MNLREKNRKKTLPLFSNEEYAELLTTIKLTEPKLREMCELRKMGAHGTGKAATAIGFSLFNTFANAKTITLKDVDINFPTDKLQSKQFLLQQQGYEVRETGKGWVHMVKMVDGLPFDLTVHNPQITKTKSITPLVSGHLHVFTSAEMRDQDSQRFMGREKDGYWCCIDTLHPDFPAFKHACKTLKYGLIPYQHDF